MAASAPICHLSVLRARYASSGHTPSTSRPSAPASLTLNLKPALVSPLRHSEAIAVSKGLGSYSSGTRRSQHVVGARRPAKDRGDGALAQAVEEIPENLEPDDMFMGKKIEGLEPDFWEGEQWDALGFIVQYMWAFGILVSLVACGVSVASYNSGAVDIRDTDVFKEALGNQVDADASFDADSFKDFPEASEAPPLK